ncbi:MAG: hypothetical protein ACK5V3_08850 [Bdellovibrionales bacterium]
MNSIVYFFTLLICLTFFSLPNAHSQCRIVVQGQKFAADVEYFNNGKKRILSTAGVIYEQLNGEWRPVGYGKLINGQVYEKQEFLDINPLSPPLIKLPTFQLAGAYSPFKLAPTVQVVDFPSNQAKFESLVQGIQIKEKKVDLIIPLNFGLEHLAEGLAQVTLNLPLKNLELLRAIRLNPFESIYFSERLYGSTTDKDSFIDLFPLTFEMIQKNRDFSVRILRHEFGHLIANKLFGRSTPDLAYITKAQKDRIGISEYGNRNWAEDFAEAVEIYLRTNAGSLDPSVRQQLKNRFEFLDSVFADRSPAFNASVKSKSNQNENRPKIIVSMIGRTHMIILVPELGRGLYFSIN